MVEQTIENIEAEAPEATLMEPSLEQQRDELRNLEPLPGETQVSGITVCNAGTSRSALMEELLEARDYKVRHYGVAGSEPFGDDLVDEIASGHVQFIVCATEGIAARFKQRFAELAEQKGVVLNVPIRALDLSEGPGIGWWRTHRDDIEVEDDGNSPYRKEEYVRVVNYLKAAFDDLGLIDRTPKTLDTQI